MLVQRRKKGHSYLPPLDVFGGLLRSFGWAKVCNKLSLRTSGASVGEARANTIKMTCWSRDRGALMT